VERPRQRRVFTAALKRRVVPNGSRQFGGRGRAAPRGNPFFQFGARVGVVLQRVGVHVVRRGGGGLIQRVERAPRIVRARRLRGALEKLDGGGFVALLPREFAEPVRRAVGVLRRGIIFQHRVPIRLRLLQILREIIAHAAVEQGKRRERRRGKSLGEFGVRSGGLSIVACEFVRQRGVPIRVVNARVVRRKFQHLAQGCQRGGGVALPRLRNGFGVQRVGDAFVLRIILQQRVEIA